MSRQQQPQTAITSDEQQELAKQLQQARASRDAQDIRDLVSTLPGRRFLMGLISACQTFETAFIGSAEVHYRGGKQAVGMAYFKRLMDEAPEAWPLMLREAAEDHLK